MIDILPITIHDDFTQFPFRLRPYRGNLALTILAHFVLRSLLKQILHWILRLIYPFRFFVPIVILFFGFFYYAGSWVGAEIRIDRAIAFLDHVVGDVLYDLWVEVGPFVVEITLAGATFLCDFFHLWQDCLEDTVIKVLPFGLLHSLPSISLNHVCFLLRKYR